MCCIHNVKSQEPKFFYLIVEQRIWESDMQKSNFLFRVWYYFRMGYGTYLTFVLGIVTTLVTVYYLAINNIPFLQSVFPAFWVFSVISLIVGIPSAVMLGWFHVKGSAIFKSEQDITMEANPYNYKIPPGFWQEAFVPLYLELLKGMAKMLDKQKLLTKGEQEQIEQLEKKLETLIEGGYVGTPKTKADLQ